MNILISVHEKYIIVNLYIIANSVLCNLKKI